MQSGFPSQFYLALPQHCKHIGLMQPLIGLCEIIACLREKWDKTAQLLVVLLYYCLVLLTEINEQHKALFPQEISPNEHIFMI